MIPAVSLGLVGFMPRDRPGLSVALLIVNGGVSAAGLCGFQVNHLDLSPNHSGILMGLTNEFSSVFSIVSPLIVQYIVTDPVNQQNLLSHYHYWAIFNNSLFQTNQFSWRIIFITTASIYAVANVFYCIFGSGEVQPWNDVEEDDEEVPIL